jgi:4-diphosphocytidyl-2-C-methyl-D-erythritol kinase
VSISVFAPAKVNLYLHVTGRRADGYHLLDSLAVFPKLGDEVRAEAADDLSLTLGGPMAAGLQAESDNIVLKAARALATAAGIEPKAALFLNKRLPIASGIGGGSTDGAAALRALAGLWRLSFDEDKLAAIGLSIGADLPVCMRKRPTRMAGIGEQLSDAPPLPKVWMLLVNPGVALPTPSVFKARVGDFSPAMPLTETPADAHAFAHALSLRGNDLTAPALILAPVIAGVLDALAVQPGCLLFRMSGSGATCFGLFETETEARSASEAIARARPGWWIAAGEMQA